MRVSIHHQRLQSLPAKQMPGPRIGVKMCEGNGETRNPLVRKSSELKGEPG